MPGSAGSIKAYWAQLPSIAISRQKEIGKKLEYHKIISRSVYAEVPPRVEYELTAIGYELAPIIKMLESLGEKRKKCVA